MDKKTIQRFKEGDAEAFDLIYSRYAKKMYYFAMGLVKDEETSKDMVQETFINLWEKKELVNPYLNIDNYIFTIVYNSIRKFFRKKAIETKVIDHITKNSPEYIKSSDGPLIYNELLEIANKTIEKLPPQRKKVYRLSKQEGMKIKEIASKLNISHRTAENHLARALKYLKEELAGISLQALLLFHLFLS